MRHRVLALLLALGAPGLAHASGCDDLSTCFAPPMVYSQSANNNTGGVSINLGAYASLASPAFTGTPTAPTPALNDNTTKLATTAFVTSALGPVTITASTAVTQQQLALALAPYLTAAAMQIHPSQPYTVSGAIALGEAYSVVDCPAACTVTLAPPADTTHDGPPHTITSIGTAQVQFNLSFYGTSSGGLPLNQGSTVNVFWAQAFNTYLYVN